MKRSDMDSREIEPFIKQTIERCAEIAEHYCDNKQYGVGPDSDPAEAYKAAREFVQQGIAREIRRLIPSGDGFTKGETNGD